MNKKTIDLFEEAKKLVENGLPIAEASKRVGRSGSWYGWTKRQLARTTSDIPKKRRKYTNLKTRVIDLVPITPTLHPNRMMLLIGSASEIFEFIRTQS